MLTSVVNSSRSVWGSVIVGVSEATLTGSVRTVRGGWGASATWRWTCGRLSWAVGKRSANCGWGKRSLNVSIEVLSPEALDLAARDFAPSVFAASMSALGALPHWIRTKDSGTHNAAIATQCHRSAKGNAKGNGKGNDKARRGMAGDVTRPARSTVWNFGIDPTIHPNAPRSTVNRRELARV